MIDRSNTTPKPFNQARVGLNEYFEFYNYERLHQSLDYHTPAQVYLNNSSDNPVLYQPNSIVSPRPYPIEVVSRYVVANHQ
jgi:hypothetical protein